MKAALAINLVTADLAANLERVEAMVREAAASGAELVLLPETAVMGFIHNDDPSHDLPLAQPIPGPLTQHLAALATELGVYLGFGLLERDGRRLYDSAVLLDSAGKLVLHHRRLHPGWLGSGADRQVYSLGDSVPAAATPLGRFAFLICGDLWDEAIVELCRRQRPDYVLYPIARCFPSGDWDQQCWEREERAEYIGKASRVGATVLMVNYLATANLNGGAFGGAMVVLPHGQVLTEWPLGRPGLLLADVRPALRR